MAGFFVGPPVILTELYSRGEHTCLVLRSGSERLTMGIGTFTLRRFNGDEIYPLKSAKLSFTALAGHSCLLLEVDTEESAMQRCPDTAAYPTNPNAEVWIILDHADPHRLVGSTFTVPAGFDEQIDDHVALFYYYDHNELNANTIEVLSRDDDTYYIRWTATADDVNYYDGSKPDARIEIEGRFILCPAAETA